MFRFAATIAAAAAAFPNSNQTERAFEIVLGLENGFFPDDVKVGQECVNEASVVVVDIEEAITDLDQKTINGFKSGFKKLSEALKAIPDTMTGCEHESHEVADFIKSLKAFHSPMSLAFHIGKDLLVNGKDILAEVTSAVEDWKKQQYKDFGLQIGSALRKLLTGDEPAVMLGAPNPKQVLDIVKGLEQGFFPADVKVGEECLNGATLVVSDFEEAVTLLENRTLATVKQGLSKLGAAFSEVPKALSGCQHEEKEVAEFIASLKALSNPVSFVFQAGKNLLVNGKDILGEVEAAIKDWRSENYEDFGLQVGKALHQLLIGTETVIVV